MSEDAGGRVDELDAGGEKERTRKRLAPEVRRAELLNAALEVFAELGFGRATLQDVADRAGVTKGALYHYFESKEQLFIELMRERLLPSIVANEEMLQTAAGSRDEVLRMLIGGIWRNFQRPGQIELARLAMTELPKFPEVGRILFEEVTRRGRQTLRRALERGIERGELCAGVTEEVVAIIPYMVMGVALGLHVFRGIDPIAIDAERGEALVSALLLRGVGRACAERTPPAEGGPG